MLDSVVPSAIMIKIYKNLAIVASDKMAANLMGCSINLRAISLRLETIDRLVRGHFSEWSVIAYLVPEPTFPVI
jgi:hypothetical protein